MIEIRHESRGNRIAVLKVLYLLAVTAVAFAVPAFAWTQGAQWFVMPALVALQIIALLICRIKPAEIRNPIWRPGLRSTCRSLAVIAPIKVKQYERN